MTNPQSVPAVAEDLAWMTGNWYGNTAGDPISEYWSTPGGDVLMCMFRWLKQGKVYLYEFVTIEPEGDSLALRIKHFNLGGIGWEEKDYAVKFYLTAIAPNQVTFDKPEPAPASRIIYRRDEDNLYSILEGTRDGKPVTLEFHYKLAE